MRVAFMPLKDGVVSAFGTETPLFVRTLMPTSTAVLYGQSNVCGAVNILQFPFARVIHDQAASHLFTI